MMCHHFGFKWVLLTAFFVATCAVVAQGIDFRTPQDEADYYYRRDYGHHNVVWLNGLLTDNDSGLLSEADMMRELWAERPTVMTALYSKHGEFSSCFRRDLFYTETIGPIAQDSNGADIYFSTSQYLDSQGQVISGQERNYNNAVRANGIVANAIASAAALSCAPCPTNGRCWKLNSNNGTYNCNTVSAATSQCEIDQVGNPCGHQCITQ